VPGTHDSAYTGQFLVDTGATDAMAPAKELVAVGIRPIARRTYELADGRSEDFEFGIAQFELAGEVTAGRILFGPDDVEPILGVTVLESVGLSVDPVTQTLQRLPAIPLK
jgi:clan AA aspartic protease